MVLSSFIVIVVLGCHIPEILDDRVQTAVNFAVQQEKPVKWFLTGGIKNHVQNIQSTQISEATQMIHTLGNSDNWSFIIDDQAKNTAENFANFGNWINGLDRKIVKNVDVYMTTSKFHHKRASTMFNLINKNITVNWLLGNVSCSYCENDEIIHMRNVMNDVRKVLTK